MQKKNIIGGIKENKKKSSAFYSGEKKLSKLISSVMDV